MIDTQSLITPNHVYPTVYDNSVIIQELAGETLDAAQWSQIAEIVGVWRLHEVCKSNINPNIAKAAINKYNAQNKTRLTLDCVKNLTPTYSFQPFCDPIIYSSDLFEMKLIAAKEFTNRTYNKYDTPNYKTVESVLGKCDFSLLDYVLVFFPEMGDDNEGFWVLYKSPYYETQNKISGVDLASSKNRPPPISDFQGKCKAFCFPDDIEASFCMEPEIREKYKQILWNHKKQTEGGIIAINDL